MTFGCHWKSMDSWVGTKRFAIFNGYNAPTIFRKIVQAWALTWKNHDTPNMAPTMIHIHACRIKFHTPGRVQGIRDPQPGDKLESL